MKFFTEEQWHAAQKYEMRYAMEWMKGNVPDILKELRVKRLFNSTAKGCPNYIREFFEGSVDLWREFCGHIKDKNSIEICSGPVGALSIWKEWMNGPIVIIDPLAEDYNNYQMLQFGESVFDEAGIILKSHRAEEMVDAFTGWADGCIVIRNSLDHCLDPKKVIENVGKYARSGCYLLFWSEIWHTKGADEGHRDVTRDPSEIEDWIKEAGFRIIREVPRVIPKELDLGIVEYGCFAVKE